MRRIAALVLAMILLAARSAPARAATRPLRFLVNDNGEVSAWLREHHPEISVENLHDGYAAPTERVLDELQSEDGPDLYLLDSSACDLIRVLDSGLVEDLSGNEDIRRAVSEQYEPFQRLVSGGDGRIYGMFGSVHGDPTLIAPAAWEAAGLDPADAPRSYEELLDFAWKWMERVREGSVGNVRLNTIRFAGYPRDERRYTLWLTGLLREIAFSRADALVGIAASGRTPYVLGAMAYARSLGALTIGLTSCRNSRMAGLADICIAPITGPEVVTGSTRMKSGTAQKLVLNMLSTAVMIKLGKVYGNLMVDVQASNEKLVERAVAIVSAAAGVDAATARRTLEDCDFHCKQAIVMLLLGVGREAARRALEAAQGHVSRVVSSR